VVIPTRNRWPMLSRTLGTALAQDVALEIVIVDDASGDETPQRLRELADPRVRSIRHNRREGAARSRNDGIVAARAAWIAFLDDDDLWAPDKLRRQLAAVHGEGADWCWSAYVAVDASLETVYLSPAARPGHLAQGLLRENVLGGPSGVLARTDLLCALGGFDTALSGTEDWDLWIRLAAGAKGAAVPEVLWAYVEHGTNMLAGTSSVEAHRPDFERLAAKHGAAAERLGLHFGATGWTGWAASRHRQAGRRFRAAATYLRGAISERSPGQLARAVLAIAGAGVWKRAHALVVGPPEAPPWLAELAAQPSAPRSADRGAA